MRGAGRADQGRARAAACRSSGSSTSCMRSLRWSIGWWCCTAARLSREGDPTDGDPPPAGARDLHGNSRRCLNRSSTCGRSTPSTATSRRCSASRCASQPARWSRSSAPTAPANRRCSSASPARCRRAATRSCSTASRSATCLRMRWSARGIALVPEGRRLFPSLTVEENLLIGGQLGAAGTVEPGARSTSCFPVLAERRHAAEHVAVRRPAADGRHRPRADVESEAAAVRRDQPRPRADRDARHLCALAGDRRAKACRSSSSSRTSCRR